MNENVLQTLQQFIQDVLAPDVRELKVRIGVIEKQIGALEKQIGRAVAVNLMARGFQRGHALRQARD